MPLSILPLIALFSFSGLKRSLISLIAVQITSAKFRRASAASHQPAFIPDLVLGSMAPNVWANDGSVDVSFAR